MSGKMEVVKEFQFLEVTGTNVMGNEVPRHLSNLTANGCWESAKRVQYPKHALGELMILTHQSTCREVISIK